MKKDDTIRVEDMKNLIMLIKSDLYCQDWNDVIEQKVDILNEVEDLLASYLDIEQEIL